MDITSPQNPRIKHLVRLRDDKRIRKQEGLMLVEGWNEIQFALEAGYKPQTILSAPELATHHPAIPSAENLTVSASVFEKISYRDNPDGWIAIIPIPITSFEEIKLGELPLVIVAESVEKPGNLGAILRTADAAGVDALLLCDPRVDMWNPNVVRASRGAVFSVPVVECDNMSALEWIKHHKIQLLAATPSAEELYSSVDLAQPIAIAVGTEDEGLTNFWMDNADKKMKIPMFGRINSLNVSVSTALILYEAVRQRN